MGAARHDFSTNSNAAGPCPHALAVVQGADTTRYPDAGYARLRRQLGAFHGVDPRRVLLAASASEFIFRITAWVARNGGRGVHVPPQGYGDYAQAARAWGLQQVARPRQAQLAWACDPSSPQGVAQPGLDELSGAGGTVVLDLAYEPLRLQGTLQLGAAGLQRIWQLWTPNKALGLTGVRAAYAIAPAGCEDAARELESLCPSWPVGAHGVALLQAWCDPAAQAWLAQSRHTLRGWKARQVALCESLGWTCLPSDANFFCARHHAADPGRALDALRTEGVKLRDAASFGLPGHARLGVLPPASQDALALAWLHILETAL